jgi:hypothetical protein
VARPRVNREYSVIGAHVVVFAEYAPKSINLMVACLVKPWCHPPWQGEARMIG